MKAKLSKIDLVYSLSRDVPETVISDPNRIRQILLNLLSNALKFTVKGEIILSCDLYEDDPSVLQFSVKDTGIGMNPDTIKRIFTPFNKAESSNRKKYNQQGCGLGLVISYKIASGLVPNSLEKIPPIQVNS